MDKKIIAVLIAIVAIASVVVFSGCVEKEEVTPSIPTPKTELSLGESAIVDDVSFTVVRFEESHMYNCTYDTTPRGPIYPAEGAKFVWVYVKAKNVGEVAREIPARFNIKMLYKGEEIHEEIHSRGIWMYRFWDNSIEREIYHDQGEIYPTVSEEGWILYEVPEGIDMSQAKICVEFEKGKTITWSFTS